MSVEQKQYLIAVGNSEPLSIAKPGPLNGSVDASADAALRRFGAAPAAFIEVGGQAMLAAPLLDRKPQKTLTYDVAMAAMRKPNARLVRMNSRAEGFFVVPGGPVEDGVADRIMNHPLVRAGRDVLFPGHDQTWRMVGGT
jgi:hypothetical protein